MTRPRPCAPATRRTSRRSPSATAAGTGPGYLNGSQTNLDFVPAQHTDFIFTVVGEEFGFVGGLALLVLLG